MMYCCENNIVQAEDNNANEIDEMAYMLWDIYVSYESKHIWEGYMRHEVLHLEWSHLESLIREINIDEDGFSLYGFQCMLNVDTNHDVTGNGLRGWR